MLFFYNLLACGCATVIPDMGVRVHERIGLVLVSGLPGALTGHEGISAVSGGAMGGTDPEIVLQHWRESHILLLSGCGGLAAYVLVRLAKRRRRRPGWNTDGNHYNRVLNKERGRFWNEL